LIHKLSITVQPVAPAPQFIAYTRRLVECGWLGCFRFDTLRDVFGIDSLGIHHDMTSPVPFHHPAHRSLVVSAGLWWFIAAASQLVFATYVVGFYGAGAARGDLSVWNAIMRNGFLEGDGIGNATVMIHVLLAAYITVAGLLQLIPAIRKYAPTVHRWNGRLYLTVAVVMACSGLLLVWGRPAAAALPNDLAVSLNGILILLCAVFTVRYAMQRKFVLHQRWAIRLFLVVSGVWFLRVMIFGWVLLHQAPVGLGENLDGPMGIAFSFASTLLPLAIYELYYKASKSGNPPLQASAAALLGGLTMLTALGSVGTTLMWLQRL